MDIGQSINTLGNARLRAYIRDSLWEEASGKTSEEVWNELLREVLIAVFEEVDNEFWSGIPVE